MARLRQVAGLVEVELAVLDPEDERVPLGLGEVELVAVRVGRVVHHVQPGLVGLVRGSRGVGGDVHLDPALVEWPRVGPPRVDWQGVVTRCVHALRLLRPDRVVSVSVPDPVSAGFSAAEEAAWYARLPTMFAASAALFTSADGR